MSLCQPNKLVGWRPSRQSSRQEAGKQMGYLKGTTQPTSKDLTLYLSANSRPSPILKGQHVGNPKLV